MITSNLSESSTKGFYRKEVQKKFRDIYGDSISYTVEISEPTTGKSTLSDQKLRNETPSFLSAAKNRNSNNIVIHQKRKNLSHVSKQKIMQYDSVITRQNSVIVNHKDLSTPTLSRSDIINVAAISKEDLKSRITVRFLIKKSKRFCGAIRFCLSKSVTSNHSKFKSLISSLKDSVISSLANNAPSSKTLKKITDKVINTLKIHQLPECMRFRSFSLTPMHKLKKYKSFESKTNLPIYSKTTPKNYYDTFLNPIKKPELQDPEGFNFPKPKIYECGYCQLRFYKIPVYLKHIRRHRAIIRCVSCDKAFMSIISKRRHQLQCRKKCFQKLLA